MSALDSKLEVTTHSGRAAVKLKDFPQIVADCGRQEDAEEYARLFAAAPDLLRALSAIMGIYGGTIAVDKNDPRAVVAKIAIAKATGKESP
jgi:hypothetical protein